MKIGIGIPNQVRDVRSSGIPEWAATAEQAGFSTLATVGRVAYPGVDDSVALAAAAGATKTIGLLSGILLGTVWPPVLLAKVAASIDGVSGGRLTLGLGIGSRPDDFVVEGRPHAGLGKRIDSDLEVYRQVWRGEPVGGGENPAVPAGTREVPMIFGGLVPAAFRRMARWGTGYIGASLPAGMVEPHFEAARAAWSEEGRSGAPRLVAIAYFGLTDADAARADIHDYYSPFGSDFAGLVSSGVATTAADVQAVIKSYDAIGADELIFNPGTDDPAEIAELAALLP